MIGIIDCDAGDIRSVEKTLQYLGEESVVTRGPHLLEKADAVLAASLFHYKELEISRVKEFLYEEKRINKEVKKMAPLSGEWLEALKDEFHQPYYASLYKKVMEEYQTRKIFPPAEDMFNAFHFTPLKEVKVVILGQDPYHNDGQAHGLCFSVKKDVEIPPSLVNIYQELHDDLGCEIPDNGYLEKWARQGVLMLNTVLTVCAHQANSHRGIGWEKFTDAAIRVLNEQDRPIVFLLWGRPAQMKKSMLDNPKHLILEAPHPSPLSAYRGFFGCRHFSKTNEFLVANGLSPIDWQIENK